MTPPDADGRRPGGDDVPDLDPQFAEALREAAGGAPGGETEGPAEPEGRVAEKPPESDEPAGEPGDTVEYAPGEAPDEQPPEAEEGETAAEEVDAEGEPEDVQEEEESESKPEPKPAPDPTLISHRGRAEVRAAIAEAARSGEPWAPTPPPASGDPEPPPKRRRLWLRFAIGSLLIIASFAGATSATGLLRLERWLNQVRPVGEGVEKQLASVDGGEPQTFLILGSDRRAEDGSLGLSDTTILLRLDPDRNLIALLNIPRDLKVHIPGLGTDKFNAAYAHGGPKLTLRTVKRLTRGMGLQINHLVNVNFLGFAQAINALDCVYIDVDRRYFHSNAGLPANLQYDEINLQPGYQRLCGEDALDYARYRHTDTDLVRAARQQDFLREARQRVPASELFKELGGGGRLIDIFTSHTQSDIDDLSTMKEVLELLIEARNAPIREIRFPAVLGPSYVYASRPAIKDAIEEFLGFELQSGPRGSLDDAGAAPKSKPRPREARNRPKRESSSPPRDDGLVDASEFGREMGRGIARKVGADFHVFYPRRLPDGTVYDQTPRVYHLKDTGGDGHEAYKIVLTVALPDGTHYFGLQGIRAWEDPPILRNPSETREIRGREYDIYVTGDRVRLVAWRDGDNSYWVSNSLLRTLTNDQMLGIARSTGELTPKPKSGRKKQRRKK